MAGCVHLNLGSWKFRSKGLRIPKMRCSWAVVVAVVVFSVSGLGQQNRTFKVGPSPDEKVPKSSAPVGKTANSVTASAANARSLENLEHQSARTFGSSRSAGNKKTAVALKPVKDKPNPPINFGATGGGKKSGTTNQGSNPYAGRLKQKRSH